MHLYATGGHGFGVRRTEAPITDWPTLAETWLQTIGVLAAPGDEQTSDVRYAGE
jgi:hypothetical protein